jgi:hypothetical protein
MSRKFGKWAAFWGLLWLAAPALIGSVALVGSGALAGSGPAPEGLASVQSASPDAPARGRSDCELGNLNPPASLVSGYFTGAEIYKYLIYPPDQCSCEQGFQLENVHMLLSFEPGMVPVTFEVLADLEEAVWDPETGCWVPGSPVCTSAPFVFHIVEPGTYEIIVPMDGCPCAAMDYYYFLGMHFLTLFEADLVIDAFPAPCIAYNDKGSGWVDLYEWFSRSSGAPIIWGDVICCTPAVPTQPSSWGGIKSLYR